MQINKKKEIHINNKTNKAIYNSVQTTMKYVYVYLSEKAINMQLKSEILKHKTTYMPKLKENLIPELLVYIYIYHFILTFIKKNIALFNAGDAFLYVVLI